MCFGVVVVTEGCRSAEIHECGYGWRSGVSIAHRRTNIELCARATGRGRLETEALTIHLRQTVTLEELSGNGAASPFPDKVGNVSGACFTCDDCVLFEISCGC